MFLRTWRHWQRCIVEAMKSNALRRGKRPRPPFFRPRLEALEERACPSATIGDVFYIELENHNLTQPSGLTGSPEQLLGNSAAPYLNSLITPGMINPVTGLTNPAEPQTSYTSDYFNVDYNNPSVSIHPSLPNYIWQEAGIPATPGTPLQDLTDGDPYQTNPLTGNNFMVNASSLSALLQNAYGAAGWMSYQEDMQFTGLSVPTVTASGTIPLGGTNLYNGSTQYSFAARHDGTLYFPATNGGTLTTPGPTDNTNSEAAFYAPLSQLTANLTNPNYNVLYNIITPDIYNDMHGPADFNFTYNGVSYLGSPTNPGSDQESVALGDNFLSIIIPEIMNSNAWKTSGNDAIVIRMDETEGGNSTAFTLPEIVISPLAKGNAYDSTAPLTHSSDLKSLQELFNVTGGGLLGDAKTSYTSDLSDLFQPGALGTPVVTAPVVTQIAGAGVWRYEASTGWQQLTPANASMVGVDPSGDVVAEIPGNGVWRYEDATKWTRLTPADASQVSIAGAGIVAVEIPSFGVWRYEDATAWKNLTTGNASKVDVDASGDVVAEIPGFGVWRYEDATAWKNLTGVDASQVSIAGAGIVAVELPGYGVWRYEDATGWGSGALTTANASSVDVDASGDVAIAIPGFGVWRYEDATAWSQLNLVDASLMAIDASGDVVVNIPGAGVRRWDGTFGWEQLTVANASALDA